MCLFFSLLILLSFFSRATEPVQVFTDDLGRKVTVPAHPKRIVSLHDLDTTIPLIELGVPPIASHGRTRPDGSHSIRFDALLTGVDFDNSSAASIGTADVNIEAIVAAKPDLIVTEPTRNTPIEQLEKTAPTASIDHLKGGAPEIHRKLAELTGMQLRLAILERRYQVQIDALKATLDSQKITVSMIQTDQGKTNVIHSYHSLGRVLRNAGFRFPLLIESVPEGGRMDVSAGRLPELDADFVFTTWRSGTGGKPQDELAATERVMPGWCQSLIACRSRCYVLISREETTSNSFASLGLMAAQIQSRIAGRPLPEAK